MIWMDLGCASISGMSHKIRSWSVAQQFNLLGQCIFRMVQDFRCFPATSKAMCLVACLLSMGKKRVRNGNLTCSCNRQFTKISKTWSCPPVLSKMTVPFPSCRMLGTSPFRSAQRTGRLRLQTHGNCGSWWRKRGAGWRSDLRLVNGLGQRRTQDTFFAETAVVLKIFFGFGSLYYCLID